MENEAHHVLRAILSATNIGVLSACLAGMAEFEAQYLDLDRSMGKPATGIRQPSAEYLKSRCPKTAVPHWKPCVRRS